MKKYSKRILNIFKNWILNTQNWICTHSQAQVKTLSSNTEFLKPNTHELCDLKIVYGAANDIEVSKASLNLFSRTLTDMKHSFEQSMLHYIEFSYIGLRSPILIIF